MKIIYTKDYEKMSIVAANIISAQVLTKSNCVLGLATGSTPIGVYQQLIKKYENEEVSFKNCFVANLDEYAGLDINDKQSYAYFMNEYLFSKIDIDKKNTFIPNGKNKDVEAECKRYDDVVNSLGQIDLQLLGIGTDGHIGFNEPSDTFAKNTNYVTLKESTVLSNARFFDKIEDVPTHAFTVGINTIMKAKKVLLLANGEKKAETLYKAVAGDINPMLPASILQLHNNAIIVADDAALKVIKEKCPEMISYL